MVPGKKKSAAFVCLHCTKEFTNKVHWCTHCENHISEYFWREKDGVCEDCANGTNDWYLERRKSRPERLAAAIKEMENPDNWLDSKVSEAYDKWVSSPEYESRFEDARAEQDKWRRLTGRFAKAKKEPTAKQYEKMRNRILDAIRKATGKDISEHWEVKHKIPKKYHDDKGKEKKDWGTMQWAITVHAREKDG